MFEAFKFKCIEKATAATKTGKARQEHHNIFILIIKIRNEQCLNGWTDIRTLLGADRQTDFCLVPKSYTTKLSAAAAASYNSSSGIAHDVFTTTK